MSATPYTDAELAQLLLRVSAIVRTPGKPIPLHIVGLLNHDMPRLVTELREVNRVKQNLANIGAKAVTGLTNRILDLESQLVARDAQIARYRQIVEHEEVANAEL